MAVSTSFVAEAPVFFCAVTLDAIPMSSDACRGRSKETVAPGTKLQGTGFHSRFVFMNAGMLIVEIVVLSSSPGTASLRLGFAAVPTASLQRMRHDLLFQWSRHSSQPPPAIRQAFAMLARRPAQIAWIAATPMYRHCSWAMEAAAEVKTYPGVANFKFPPSCLPSAL